MVFLAVSLALSVQAQIPTKGVSVTKRSPEYYRVEASYPQFLGRDSFAKEVNQSVKKDCMDQVNEFLKYAREFRATEKRKPVAEWEFIRHYTVSISQPQLFCIMVEEYDYSGGAHPNSWMHGRNYREVKGKAHQLEFSDLIKPGVTPAAFIENKILPQLNDLKRRRGVESVQTFDPMLLDNFVLTPSGISFLINKYDVGPYVEGEYILKFSKEAVAEWLAL